MSTTKMLGKIDFFKFGIGGYQDAMLGFDIGFTMSGSGINSRMSFWDKNLIKVSEHSKWSEADRADKYSDIMYKISDLLNLAKVKNINDLVGVPVELEFDSSMSLKDWRILTEVL